jgi:hypothetical protein
MWVFSNIVMTLIAKYFFMKKDKSFDNLKGERHSKITGTFNENLLLYFLSKTQYEPVLVDYTGIDIVAYNKATKRRLGISVKSRSKTMERPKSEGLTINATEYEKINRSCVFFDCEPWICFIIDRPIDNSQGEIFLFLFPLDVALEYYPGFKTKKQVSFTLIEKKMNSYNNDERILKMNFNYSNTHWKLLPSKRDL